jgi:hypothetical protein
MSEEQPKSNVELVEWAYAQCANLEMQADAYWLNSQARQILLGRFDLLAELQLEAVKHGT